MAQISVSKTFQIEIQKRGPNNSDILQNRFPPEIKSPLFNLWKFQDSEKSLPHSSRIYWNLMNDEEFRSIELFRVKYRRVDQKIQTLCKIGSPQKLGPPYLICRKFRTLRKVFLIHAEWTGIQWLTKNLGLKNF